MFSQVLMNVQNSPFSKRVSTNGKMFQKAFAGTFKYEQVIKNTIDEANASGDKEIQRRIEAGEELPGGEFGVWDRDFKEETLQPIEGKTYGQIPQWLKGSLVRNGPGILSFGNDRYKHLFDGAAVLHRFKFQNGKATYQNRILKSNTFKKNHAAQRIVVSEFGTKKVTDPCQTIFQRFKSVFEKEEATDNCCVSIYPYGDEVYAMTEVPKMIKIDPNTLETLNPVNVTKMVNVVHHSAHPHVERNGLVSNVGILVDGSSGFKYSIVEFPNTKRAGKKGTEEDFSKAILGAKVPCQWKFHPSYMHSFGLTENYYVIIEQPMCLSMPNLIASKFTEKEPYEILKWYDDFPTLIHLVSRETGECTTYTAESFFFFHTINQYEEEGHVVIDLCAFKDGKIVSSLDLKSMKDAKNNPDYSKLFRARPVRFVLPLNGPKESSSENLVTLRKSDAKAYRGENGEVHVVPEVLSNVGLELPRFDYARLGRKYRYFYGMSTDIDVENPGMLVKVDAVNKETITWGKLGELPSEPIFVPAPDQKEEDDGVIVSAVLTDDPDEVAALVLDARNFKELGRTVFKATGPIPRGIHGWYFP